MMTSLFHRSKFALRLASLLPGRGLTSTLLHADGSTSENKSGVRKLDYDGKPADGTQMITPLIVHKGLNYISGQGANDAGSAQRGDIESHTTKVMNNVKKLVEGGGSMDNIPQLTGASRQLGLLRWAEQSLQDPLPSWWPARVQPFPLPAFPDARCSESTVYRGDNPQLAGGAYIWESMDGGTVAAFSGAWEQLLPRWSQHADPSAGVRHLS